MQVDFYYEIKINGVQKALESNNIPDMFENVTASAGGQVNPSADILVRNFNATQIGGVDGGWDEWSDWMCEAGCGGDDSLLKKYRYCKSPEPKYGGTPCEGDDKIIGNKSDLCNQQTCEGKI